jgi:hypothetical protein
MEAGMASKHVTALRCIELTLRETNSKVIANYGKKRPKPVDIPATWLNGFVRDVVAAADHLAELERQNRVMRAVLVYGSKGGYVDRIECETALKKCRPTKKRGRK